MAKGLNIVLVVCVLLVAYKSHVRAAPASEVNVQDIKETWKWFKAQLTYSKSL